MDYEVNTSFMSPWDPDYVESEYEENVEDGLIRLKFRGQWYPIAEAEPDYDIFNDHWYPVPDSAQDYFPFYDLTDRDLNALYGYGPSDQDLYELAHDPPDEDSEDQLDYDDPDADDPYDLELAAY